MVAKGEPVRRSALDKVKSTFLEQDYSVNEAIQDLKEKCDFYNINLTLDDMRFMEMMIYSKTAIRLEVRRILFALETGNIGNEERERARQICEKIDDLNAKFCSADTQLRKHL